MEIDPETLTPGLRYNLVIGTVVPRPIAVVGTVSIDGRPNLAPFSCFMYAGTNPLTLVVSPANPSTPSNAPGSGPPDLPQAASEKDTLRNAKPVSEGGTGEFTVSIATEATIQRVVACAEPLAHGDSEFEFAGLRSAPSTKVSAPRLADTPVSFECVTTQVIRLNPGAPGGGNLLIGTVVNIHLRDDLAHERYHIDAARLRAVGRMGGPQYCTTRERATIPMGAQALATAVEWQRDAGSRAR
jgi:flavin reductase (DIM6/NTAB) family NADH-FMN oxidoreductase RutF